jgi:hypothetical protein
MSSNTTAVAANPSLAGLPMEMLHRIFGQVSSKDQRQLRRVSKRCCTAVDSLSERDYKQIARSFISDVPSGLPPSRIRCLNLANVPFVFGGLKNIEKLDKSSRRYNGDHITELKLDTRYCDVESTVRILDMFPTIELLSLKGTHRPSSIRAPFKLTEIITYTINGIKYTQKMPLAVWPLNCVGSGLPPYFCNEMSGYDYCKTCTCLIVTDDQD